MQASKQTSPLTTSRKPLRARKEEKTKTERKTERKTLMVAAADGTTMACFWSKG